MRPARAFSLLEVVIATGVFAVAIVTTLALVPNLLKVNEDVHHTLVALQLPDGIQGELKKIATGNIDNVATRFAAFGASTEGSLRLVAASNGTDVRELSIGEGPARDQFFLIELFQFPTGSPLGYNPSAAYVAVNVRVRWPYRTLTPSGLSDATDANDRQQVSFNLILNR